MYHDHIRTHFRDLFADAAFRALADGQHGNNRGHADDDAESRQKERSLLEAMALRGYFEKIGRIHVFLYLIVLRKRKLCQGLCGRQYVGVQGVFPYQSVAQCDIAAAVLGYLRVVRYENDGTSHGMKFWNNTKISKEVRVSRLPVASSAKSTAGSLTNARAMATRCICPPDIWLDLW